MTWKLAKIILCNSKFSHLTINSAAPVMNQPSNSLSEINQALKDRDIEKAKELFATLTEDVLTTRHASVLAARIALAEKDHGRAKMHIEAACNRGIGEEAALALWANLHLGLNDTFAERNAREKLVAISPTLAHLRALASFYKRMNDAEGALSVASQALINDKCCEWAHLLKYTFTYANGGIGLFDALAQAIADCAVCPPFSYIQNALQLLSVKERHALYESYTCKWPDELKFRLELAIAAGRIDDLLLILHRLYPSEHELISSIDQIVRRQLSRGAIAHAEELARKTVAECPTSSKAHSILYSAMLKAASPNQVAQVIRDAIANSSKYPDYHDIRLTLFGLPPQEAEELKAQIIARWPEAAPNLDTPQIDHSEAIKLTLSGQRTEALQYLQEQARSVHDSNLENAFALIKALPDVADLKRPIVVDTGEELVASPPSTNGVTVLFFTGINDRVGMDYETIDAFCAASGAASLCLRDRTKMVFLTGIRSIANERASTIAVLRQKISEMGTRKLIVFGSSGGSFSAVTYGVELGAARIICLGAQTSIHHFLEAGGDPRARMMIERIRDQFDPNLLDLRRLWQTLNQPPQLELYYGELNQNDARHAHHLKGMNNVRLRPLTGVKEHNITPLMASMGLLPKAFEIEDNSPCAQTF